MDTISSAPRNYRHFNGTPAIPSTESCGKNIGECIPCITKIITDGTIKNHWDWNKSKEVFFLETTENLWHALDNDPVQTTEKN